MAMRHLPIVQEGVPSLINFTSEQKGFVLATTNGDTAFNAISDALCLLFAELSSNLRTKSPGHSMGGTVPAGSTNQAVDPEQKIAIAIYKNPKLGGKRARIVPMVTNCTFWSGWKSHVRGYMLPGPIHGYRKLEGGVNTANQMGLQHREVRRSSTWARATRRFILRTTVVNAFTSCKQLRIIAGNNTLFDF